MLVYDALSFMHQSDICPTLWGTIQVRHLSNPMSDHPSQTYVQPYEGPSKSDIYPTLWRTIQVRNLSNPMRDHPSQTSVQPYEGPSKSDICPTLWGTIQVRHLSNPMRDHPSQTSVQPYKGPSKLQYLLPHSECIFLLLKCSTLSWCLSSLHLAFYCCVKGLKLLYALLQQTSKRNYLTKLFCVEIAVLKL